LRGAHLFFLFGSPSIVIVAVAAVGAPATATGAGGPPGWDRFALMMRRVFVAAATAAKLCLDTTFGVATVNVTSDEARDVSLRPANCALSAAISVSCAATVAFSDVFSA